MKKIILIAILILVMGCNIEAECAEKVRYIQSYGKFGFYVDKETCVEYVRYFDTSLSVRYNGDGTIRLNKECLVNENN